MFPSHGTAWLAAVMSQDPPASLPCILEHVLEQHKLHVTEHAYPAPPLIVGIQGPQGSGKSFLSNLLQDHLSTLPQPLHTVVLSVDDLYLPHEELRKVAQDHPSNPLLQGRGQPGTHDVIFGTELLNALHTINNPISDVQSAIIRLPVFDKSLHGGEGDRVPEDQWLAVAAPLDIIIFEGWFVGFAPCTTKHVELRYAEPVDSLKDIFDLKDFCTMDDLLEIRDRLTDYQAWWDHIDTFIQLYPEDGHLSYIYEWRLQQEHVMKARNGGRGMTDEQVKKFIDRYIPGYLLFAGGIKEPARHWTTRGLLLEIDKSRNVIKTKEF